MALERERQDPGVCRPPGSVRHGGITLIGPTISRLEFGRFLLSSVGLHLVLGWAVMTVGLHRSPLPERPLVVRLVEAEAPSPPVPSPQPVPARTRQGETARPSSETTGLRAIAPRELTRPSIGRPDEVPSRATEILDSSDSDRRRQTPSRIAADELVKGLGLPGVADPSSGLRLAGGNPVSQPKVLGTPGKLAKALGDSGRGGPGPVLIGDGLSGTKEEGLRGGSRKGLSEELISPASTVSGGALGGGGGNGGPRGIPSGAVTALPSGGFSPGPIILGGSEVGGGGATRGGARWLGAGLAAPLAPTVTVGSRQPTNGKWGGGEGNGAGGGKFASPGYGENPLPKYPLLAREKGYEGTVYLRVEVQRDGRVGGLAIDRSSGHEVLDRAAVDSVTGWTFLPAQKGGKPIASWVLLPVRFMLK